MTHFEVFILPSAERDIGDAYEWSAERDEAAANRWFNRLAEVMRSLETFPDRAPLAPVSKFLHREIRELFHGRRHDKYRILFAVEEQAVYLLHVRHGARLPLGEVAAAGD